MLNFLKRFWPTKKHLGPLIVNPKPKHVAVVMDGNGRWANAQGLSRIAGHKRGADSVKALIKSCLVHEIPYLSIFAFSSENWNRPSSEVGALMDLLSNALETQTKKLNENGVRLQLIGDLSKFSEKIQLLASEAQALTMNNNKLVLSVAINYGGRWDITQACRQVAIKVASGAINALDVDEDLINQHLSTMGTPDPDLFIRTSGEYRISNFFLWQAAYSELYFVDTLWPDFDEQAFAEALLNYSHRDRRFGTARDKVALDEGDMSMTASQQADAQGESEQASVSSESAEYRKRA